MKFSRRVRRIQVWRIQGVADSAEIKAAFAVLQEVYGRLLTGGERVYPDEQDVRTVLTNRPDPDAFRRVTPPLTTSEPSAYSQRARIEADVVSRDAKMLGLAQVHILTGANHAEEIARHLTR